MSKRAVSRFRIKWRSVCAVSRGPRWRGREEAVFVPFCFSQWHDANSDCSGLDWLMTAVDLECSPGASRASDDTGVCALSA